MCNKPCETKHYLGKRDKTLKPASFQVGRTEKIMNCLNPQFSKTFVIDYYFEMMQKLRFEMYDIDSDNCSLQEADFLGELECTLGQVVHACSS